MPKSSTTFKPGKSGNPKGKPKGTKNKATVTREMLAQKLIDALDIIDIEKAVKQALKDNPANVLRVIQGIIPSHMDVNLGGNVNFTITGDYAPDIKKDKDGNGGNGG